MNLHEALETSNWVLHYAFTDEMTPEEILRVKKMRDVIYYLHAAAGIAEIRLEAYEMGQHQEPAPETSEGPYPDDPRSEEA